jgi:hypothetical protein
MCPAPPIQTLPLLPEESGSVSIPAQEWPFKPGPREIALHICYPDSCFQNVRDGTGLILSLHNWGGTGFVGTADGETLARNFNVIAIGVDYLQSGPSGLGPEPYDHGWLQALDALCALHYVFDGLRRRGVRFDSSRIFTTGGSGGGNISLMANKLAPRTFAAVIDLCGMKKLGDSAAFNECGATTYARYVRDPRHPFYLSPDAQELRFLGNPQHLTLMKNLGCTAKIVSVHGIEDMVCPFAEAEEFARNMDASGLDFTFLPVTPDRIDGRVFTSAGHPLGDRTLIVGQVAGHLLDPRSPAAVRRGGPTDFERGEDVRYPTTNGTWVIRYSGPRPEGTFEPGPEMRNPMGPTISPPVER